MTEFIKNSQISGLRPEFAEKLATFSEPFLQNRQFTHIYLESGRFDRVQPAVHFSSLPGQQDLFDLASLTKALVTAPLIFQQAAQEGLNLNGTVKDWLGGNPTTLSIPLLSLLVKDLLSHKSGLPAWRNFWINRLGPGEIPNISRHEHIENTLNRFSNEISASKSFVYSDLGYILLGYILEQRNTANLSVIFSEFKKNTLNFADDGDSLNFIPQPISHSRAIPTSFCAIRGRQLVGEVHDENCAALGGISGHAGLFGTGAGIVRYLKALVSSPVGKELLIANAALITPGGDPLLGWRQRSQVPVPRLIMGHLGFTGTAFWLDSIGQSYAVLLTNRVVSGRKSPWMTQFRDGCMGLLELGLND